MAAADRARPMPGPIVHIVICTHTPRGLARTLLAAAAQAAANGPTTLTVTCDGNDPAVARVVRDIAERTNRTITLVDRAHTGRSRSGQVRNNAVRALIRSGTEPARHDHAADPILLFLDGDCIPAPGLIATHARLCRPRTLVLGFRIDLDSQQTESIDDTALAAGRAFITPTPDQLDLLRRRHQRYTRQALLRRIGLAKPHKPKLLSANFAVRLSDYSRINGFDETYEGYGQEDDDLGRRLYRAGCRPVIAIADALTFHQYHPTRAPGDWHDSPNAARFAAGRGGPTFCHRGLGSPLEQPQVRVSTFDPASARTQLTPT